MRIKHILFTLLIATSLSHTHAAQEQQLGMPTMQHPGPLHTTPTPAPKIKKPYDWNYWAAGVELGANKQFNFQRAPRQRGPHAVYQPRTPPFGLDYRFSIEKSWKIADRWTFALDLAVFTPAFAFGYLLSPRARIHFGFHIPVYMLSFNHTARNFSLPAPRVGFDILLRHEPSLEFLLHWMPQQAANSGGHKSWLALNNSFKQRVIHSEYATNDYTAHQEQANLHGPLAR
ncbi:MAG: hypothetical protein WCJ17_01505 [bacterium]